jgi:hypothetical protein
MDYSALITLIALLIAGPVVVSMLVRLTDETTVGWLVFSSILLGGTWVVFGSLTIQMFQESHTYMGSFLAFIVVGGTLLWGYMWLIAVRKIVNALDTKLGYPITRFSNTKTKTMELYNLIRSKDSRAPFDSCPMCSVTYTAKQSEKPALLDHLLVQAKGMGKRYDGTQGEWLNHVWEEKLDRVEVCYNCATQVVHTLMDKGYRADHPEFSQNERLAAYSNAVRKVTIIACFNKFKEEWNDWPKPYSYTENRN